MSIIHNGLWDYVERWQRQFPTPKKVWWNKNWIENDYCAECRFCCGPQDSDQPFPMPLLPRQSSREGADHFHMLDAYTPYLGAKGCKSDGSHGCKLRLDEKPLACGLFPIVLINGSLWLYQNCPAVVFNPLFEWMRLARSAATMLSELSFADLRHLSLWFTSDILARSYIDLRITIFDANGKKLLFG